MIAFDVRRYASVTSTNDEAARLAREEASHGTVVHADVQTSGRGRFSRRWSSPPGNLYLSIVLRFDLPPVRIAEIGFVAALAVADAADAMLPRAVRASLKWPNDVLVQNGKIAGILLENIDQALILGIGLNVLQPPSGVSHQVSTIVGSGGLATVDGTRTKLLAALSEWLTVWQRDGFAAIRASWLARAHPVGTPLSVHVGDRYVSGKFVGLEDSGAMLLDTAEGRRRIVAGDVRTAGSG